MQGTLDLLILRTLVFGAQHGRVREEGEWRRIAAAIMRVLGPGAVSG